LGYYRALDELETLAKRPKFKLTEATVKTLHALVMGGRRGKKPTPYRDGQNVIRDSRSGGIVYMPPEARDVPNFMTDLVTWINSSKIQELPCPIRAAIAHYQFATIHPYYDGNGRTARLLTTLVLHLGGYDLKGFYSLEEYYARDLTAYYDAIAVGPSHNYYEGRAEADITGWVEYFCIGMAESFNAVQRKAKAEARSGKKDQSQLLRRLDLRQRQVLTLFEDADKITANQVAKLLRLKPRTAREICQKWTEVGFFVVADPAKKSRHYSIGKEYASLTE
jgi:Fic family protein